MAKKIFPDLIFCLIILLNYLDLSSTITILNCSHEQLFERNEIIKNIFPGHVELSVIFAKTVVFIFFMISYIEAKRHERKWYYYLPIVFISIFYLYVVANNYLSIYLYCE
jgi:hypothetical protein